MIIKPVTHVIFDLDGLLIDSESAYIRIIDGIAAQYGKKYTKDIQLKILGTYEPDTARIAIEEMQLPITSEEFLTQMREGVKREMQRPPLMSVCGSSDPEVKKGKPAPDIFFVCASRFPDKPDTNQCLVFEDAPNGVRAAVSAGMQAVMVPEDEPIDEIKNMSSLILKSLNDFKPEMYGLPPRGT